MLASEVPTIALFIIGPDNNLFCIGMQTPDETDVGNTQKAVPVTNTSQERSNQDVTVKQSTPLQGVDDLVIALSSFLETNEQSKFGPTIRVLLRSLENDPSTATINQALLTIKQMLSSY